MVIDQHHQRQLGSSLSYEHMHQSYSTQPQFTDPWASSNPATSTAQLYSSIALAPSSNATPHKSLPLSHHVSMPYTSITLSGPSVSTDNGLSMPYPQQDLMSLSQDVLGVHRLDAPSYEQNRYSNAPSPTHSSYAPTSAPFSNALTYAQQQHQQQDRQHQQQHEERSLSQPSAMSNHFLGSPVVSERQQRQNSMQEFSRGLASQQRQAYGESFDAGRGMVALSQDITPRNIYGARVNRDSSEGYGFPTTHSSSSSISSQLSYYGSVDSSVSDYSSTSESLDLPSRTLPIPQGLLGGSMPPNPQAMMGQFSSKVSSSTLKKHKCKICDKRFTRPSSLQTHMYSHTGEKRKTSIIEEIEKKFH